MKKITNNLFVFSLLFVTLFFSACKKDEEPAPDVRASVVGTYNYKMKVYTTNANGQVVYAGSQYDESGTIIATKHATDNNMVEFKEGGELAFQANKFAEGSNGVGFDVPSQTQTDEDGTTYKVVGYENITLGSSKYDGAYYTADKKVNVWLKEESTSLILFFEGTKL